MYPHDHGPHRCMVLGDLGADVIKVEPASADNTRTLLGSGAGFFPLFNRNKRGIALVDGQRKGATAKTVTLPRAMDGARLDVRLNPPVHIGRTHRHHPARCRLRRAAGRIAAGRQKRALTSQMCHL
jgi:hypothetical protein